MGRWLLLISFILSAQADDQIFAPEIITLRPETVFAAPGFDSNDMAQITVSGYFLSTCFKAGQLVSKVDTLTKQIILRNEVISFTKCEGYMTPVHYSETANLGILPAGTYQISSETDGKLTTEGQITIAQAKTSNPDDFLYLALEDARIEKKSGKPNLVITGILSNSCMKLDSVKILTRTSNIIEVLPVISILPNNPCTPGRSAVKKEIPLEKLYSGDVLIHARSMSGKAINRVVEF